MIRSPLARKTPIGDDAGSRASPGKSSAKGQEPLKLVQEVEPPAKVLPASSTETPALDAMPPKIKEVKVHTGSKLSEWAPAQISGIRGLKQASEALKTNLNVVPPATHTMYDSGARNRIRMIKIILLLISISGLAWTSTTEWFQQNVVYTIQFYLAGGSWGQLVNGTKGTNGPQKSQNPKDKSGKMNAFSGGKKKLNPVGIDANDDLSLKPEEVQSRVTELLKTPRRTSIPNCRKVVDQYINATQRISVGGTLDTAECYMLMQDYRGALKVLSGYELVLQQIPESKMTAIEDFDAVSELLYALVDSSVYSGNMRIAQEVLRGRCPRWQATSSSCIAKIFVYGTLRIPLSREAAVVFESSGGIGRSSQGRLWLGGAMIAAQEGRFKVGDQRIKLALSSIPPRSQHLRRRIYDFGAIDLYHRGANLPLKTFAAKALQDLKGSDHGGLVKLRFLRDLSASAHKKTLLKEYLSNSQTSTIASKDPELLEVLGVESLRQGMLDEWSLFLGNLRKIVDRKPQADETDMNRLISLWMVRTSMAKGDYFAALKTLGDFKNEKEADPLIPHLRGVVFFLMSENPNSQLNAIAELSKAYRLKRSWESLTVLGFALARTGKADRVAAVIKDLNQMVTTPGQKYWVELLRGEYYFGQGKLLNAKKVANDLLYADPRAILPRLLLIRVLSLTKDSLELKKQQDELAELTRTNPYSSSFEGLASPFGPLAMGRRPFD